MTLAWEETNVVAGSNFTLFNPKIFNLFENDNSIFTIFKIITCFLKNEESTQRNRMFCFG